MSRKRNGFWTFIFSLLPGAGEMYLGFFKQGIGLMARFFLVIMLASYLNLGPLLFILPILWFYSFFHVHSLASLPDEEFYAVEDSFLGFMDSPEMRGYLSGERGRRILGTILILLGCSVIWNGIQNFIWNLMNRISPAMGDIITNAMDDVLRCLIAVIFVYIGIQMIRGKKKELNQIEQLEKSAGEEEKR